MRGWEGRDEKEGKVEEGMRKGKVEVRGGDGRDEGRGR